MPIREGGILCLLIAIRSLPLLLGSRHNMECPSNTLWKFLKTDFSTYNIKQMWNSFVQGYIAYENLLKKNWGRD